MGKKVGILGVALLLFGIVLMVNSFPAYTGYVIFDNIEKTSGYFLGVVFFVAGLLMIMYERGEESGLATIVNKVIVSDKIESEGVLKRAKKHAYRNEDIKREMNHLKEELEKGNIQTGRGTPGHVAGTSVFYLRGRKGARLFYHRIGDEYEIVGYSDKSKDEIKVIDKLSEMYKKTA